MFELVGKFVFDLVVGEVEVGEEGELGEFFWEWFGDSVVVEV